MWKGLYINLLFISIPHFIEPFEFSKRVFTIGLSAHDLFLGALELALEPLILSQELWSVE